jgi:hypothetical protein
VKVLRESRVIKVVSLDARRSEPMADGLQHVVIKVMMSRHSRSDPSDYPPAGSGSCSCLSIEIDNSVLVARRPKMFFSSLREVRRLLSPARVER